VVNLNWAIDIKPIFCNGWPTISVCIDQKILFNGQLTETKRLCFDNNLNLGTHEISVEFTNKTNDNPNQAVEITAIEFEGISTDRMKWAGCYYPLYPEPWYSEQQASGLVLETMLSRHTYMGWNGVWILQFDVPVFTWIHQTENLGWIYD
jgi:hypothetical protein